MPVCNNCMQTDGYYEQDGLYYCSRCDVQSQSMQVMMVGDEGPVTKVTRAFSHKVKQSQQKDSATTDESQKETVKEEVIPGAWQYQTLQIILQEQVKKLVEMGANPKLKEIVGKLWFLYLHKMNLAFSNKSSEPAANDGSKENCDVPGLPRQLAQILQAAVRGKPYGTIVDKLENDLENQCRVSPKAKSKPENTTFTQLKSPKTLSKSSVKSLENPSLQIVLCVLYLGLRFVHEPILLSDLIRWVHENSLPYYYATDLIPLKLGENNLTKFKRLLCVGPQMKPNIGDCEFLMRLKNLQKLLELPSIPAPDMAMVIARYVSILNLPSEIQKYTYRLFTTHGKPTLDGVFPHDCIALAYIIVALKLIFVLDDDAEHRLSETAQRFRRALPSGSAALNIFVWDEWVCVTKLRNQQRIADGKSTDDTKSHRVKKVDSFLAQYWKSTRLEDHRDIIVDRKQQSWEMRQERQKCLRVVGKQEGHSIHKTRRTPHRPFQSDLGFTEEEDDTENETLDTSWLDTLGTQTPNAKTSKPETHQSESQTPAAPLSDIPTPQPSMANGAKHLLSKKRKVSGEPSVSSPLKKSKIGKTKCMEETKEVNWKSREELLRLDFTCYTVKYALDLDAFCDEYGIKENKCRLFIGKDEPLAQSPRRKPVRKTAVSKVGSATKTTVHAAKIAVDGAKMTKDATRRIGIDAEKEADRLDQIDDVVDDKMKEAESNNRGKSCESLQDMSDNDQDYSSDSSSIFSVSTQVDSTDQSDYQKWCKNKPTTPAAKGILSESLIDEIIASSFKKHKRKEKRGGQDAQDGGDGTECSSDGKVPSKNKSKKSQSVTDETSGAIVCETEELPAKVKTKYKKVKDDQKSVVIKKSKSKKRKDGAEHLSGHSKSKRKHTESQSSVDDAETDNANKKSSKSKKRKTKPNNDAIQVKLKTDAKSKKTKDGQSINVKQAKSKHKKLKSELNNDVKAKSTDSSSVAVDEDDCIVATEKKSKVKKHKKSKKAKKELDSGGVHRSKSRHKKAETELKGGEGIRKRKTKHKKSKKKDGRDAESMKTKPTKLSVELSDPEIDSLVKTKTKHKKSKEDMNSKHTTLMGDEVESGGLIKAKRKHKKSREGNGEETKTKHKKTKKSKDNNDGRNRKTKHKKTKAELDGVGDPGKTKTKHKSKSGTNAKGTKTKHKKVNTELNDAGDPGKTTTKHKSKSSTSAKDTKTKHKKVKTELDGVGDPVVTKTKTSRGSTSTKGTKTKHTKIKAELNGTVDPVKTKTKHKSKGGVSAKSTKTKRKKTKTEVDDTVDPVKAKTKHKSKKRKSTTGVKSTKTTQMKVKTEINSVEDLQLDNASGSVKTKSKHKKSKTSKDAKPKKSKHKTKVTLQLNNAGGLVKTKSKHKKSKKSKDSDSKKKHKKSRKKSSRDDHDDGRGKTVESSETEYIFVGKSGCKKSKNSSKKGKVVMKKTNATSASSDTTDDKETSDHLVETSDHPSTSGRAKLKKSTSNTVLGHKLAHIKSKKGKTSSKQKTKKTKQEKLDEFVHYLNLKEVSKSQSNQVLLRTSKSNNDHDFKTGNGNGRKDEVDSNLDSSESSTPDINFGKQHIDAIIAAKPAYTDGTTAAKPAHTEAVTTAKPAPTEGVTGAEPAPTTKPAPADSITAAEPVPLDAGTATEPAFTKTDAVEAKTDPIGPNRDYIFYPFPLTQNLKPSRSNQLAKTHASFYWLLRHCASLIEQDPLKLYDSVRNVELLCVLDDQQSSAEHMKIKRMNIFAQWGITDYKP